jgi:hypothetical protein
MVLFQNCVWQSHSHQDGHHSAVALLLKAALIQVSDYRLLGASGYIWSIEHNWWPKAIHNFFSVCCNLTDSQKKNDSEYSMHNLKKKVPSCNARILIRERLFIPPRQRVGGHINLPLSSVHPSIRPSRYRCMICPAISSYSFGALIFCMMFIHIMEVCMSTGF